MLCAVLALPSSTQNHRIIKVGKDLLNPTVNSSPPCLHLKSLEMSKEVERLPYTECLSEFYLCSLGKKRLRAVVKFYKNK